MPSVYILKFSFDWNVLLIRFNSISKTKHGYNCAQQMISIQIWMLYFSVIYPQAGNWVGNQDDIQMATNKGLCVMTAPSSFQVPAYEKCCY